MRRAGLLFVLLAASAALAQPTVPTANDAEPLATLADLERLEVPRDEAAQDRIAATALLAHGRMLQQRRDVIGALRRYERAYRYDDAGRGLAEIVALAMETGRTDQAARYAALAGQQIHDLIVLRRLAVDATNRRNWNVAASLYAASLSPIGTEASRTATQVLMRAELGRLYFLSDDFQRSAQAFAEVRAALAKPEEYDLNESIQKIIIGDRRQTYSLMARAALEAGQYDEALSLFRETYHDLPDSDEAQLAEASVADRRGDATAAIKLCLPVLEREGRESAAAFDQLRRAMAKRTPPDMLEAALDKKLAPAQAAHPENVELRRQLSQCRLNQAKLAEAEALLTDPALENPTDELRLLLAETRRRQKDADKWLATLAELVVATSLSTIEEEARQAARDDEFSAAVLQVAQAGKSASAREKALLGVAAIVALERKQYDEAEKLWQASLPDEAAAKGRLLLLWGLRWTQIDQYERTIRSFQRVIDDKLAESDPAPAYYYLAGAAAFARQPELALSAAHSAKQARPGDLRFSQREAWVLQHARRFAEARNRYEGLLTQFDKSTDARVRTEMLQVRRQLSAICHQLGDEAAAIERLEEVLDEFPDDSGALNDLGYLWADGNVHLQRSLSMVKRAVVAEPENKAFRDSLGWIYFRLGRFPAAVAELELAAAGNDPGGVVLDHFGDALSKAGRPNDARSAWQKALESFRQDSNESQAAAIERKLRENDQ